MCLVGYNECTFKRSLLCNVLKAFLDKASLYSPADLKCMDLPAWPLSAGIKGKCHHAQPAFF